MGITKASRETTEDGPPERIAIFANVMGVARHLFDIDTCNGGGGGRKSIER